MDFFSQQDKARRNTGKLVLLFVVAVLGIILLTNLLIGFTFWLIIESDSTRNGVSVITQTDGSTIANLLNWRTFGLISLGVGGAVICAILSKWLQISSGGKAVAESLGGVRINTNTEDPDQRQVLNVVEEMALASGMPVPPVYLLEHELGINAFAAGNSLSDAVIGVTQGCVTHFKRDELQGVIAHEFSHILNGDMKLNIKLIALLHGIVFIGSVGEIMARSGGNRRSDGRVALLGFALMAIGWLGTFFGNLIKAAVSRQREFLADASAVQFTRNPDGIGNALKLIGGYSAGTEIRNSNRSEVSHMFFGQAIQKMRGLHATHPSLVDRILRVDPDWDGNYLYRSVETRGQKQQQDADNRESRKERFGQAVIAGAAVLSGADLTGSELTYLDDVRDQIDTLPASLYELSRDPLGAVSLCFALLLDDDQEVRKAQLLQVGKNGFRGASELIDSAEKDLKSLPSELRLPLIELLLPALKSISQKQYGVFKHTLMLLIRADRETDLFEWCLFQLVRHFLAGEFEPDRTITPKYKEAKELAEAYRSVLSLLAHQGHTDEREAEKAFNRGANATGLYNIRLMHRDECNLKLFMASFAKMAAAYPMLKRRLFLGLRKCVEQDNQIKVIEREMLTSIAAVMDCPMPVLLDSKS